LEKRRKGEIKMTNSKKQQIENDAMYNQGRLEGERKWIEAIDNRIRELELLVGIPELRRLKHKTRYL
jgi:hypothetical protein